MNQRVKSTRLLALLAVALLMHPRPTEGAFSESPDLAKRVEAGTLPPLQSRIPSAPVIIAPNDRHGDYGGTWRMALLGFDSASLLSCTLGYEQLVRWDQNWARVVPNIAHSWHVNENATHYRFNIRRGMRWSDGHPFSAADLKAWFDDVASNTELNPVAPAWLVAGGRLPRCETPNDYTLEFTFAEPNALFLEQLAGMRANEMTRYPAHYFRKFHKDHDPDGATRLMDATGQDWATAFQTKFTPWTWQNHETPTLDAWVLSSPYMEGATRLSAVRNPYYWKVDTRGRQLPYIDQLSFEITDADGIRSLALAGEIDYEVDYYSGTGADYRAALDAGRIRLIKTIPSIPNPMAISLNLTHRDPALRKALENRDVRIALSEAIDREAIIREFYGDETFPWQNAPRRDTPFFSRKLGEQYTAYRPEESRRRLDDAGLHATGADGLRQLDDGRSFKIEILIPEPGRAEWADVLKSIRTSWRSIGVGVDLKILPRTEFFSTVRANEHDAVVWWSGGGYTPTMEPEYFVPATFERLGPLRVFYAVPWARWFLDPTAEGAEVPPDAVRRQLELFRSVMAEPDRGRRTALMTEVLDMAVEQFYTIGICHAPPSFAVRTPRFQNVPGTIIDSWQYPDPGPLNPAQFFIDTEKE